MDSARSPTSPRLRPGGPRTLNRRQTSNISMVPFALDPVSPDETTPSYSGQQSPALSSQTGSISSPGGFEFEQLPAPLRPKSKVRDTREWRDEGVQVSPVIPPSRPISTASSAPAVKVIAKPPTLTPPPVLNFESTPVAWRGLPLETAQWTLSSPELQEIVSRAIRKTAQESFIRLLSVKTLDGDLVAEMERLDILKATAQSKYRFNMHRRTMLLQSLVAVSGGEGDYTAVGSLTTQIAEITASCDSLMLELIRVADQRAQIQRLQEVHVSSALAMALRKLNASYAKRTGELREAREQVDHLRAELEEAWKVAEEMAQEMDDLDNFHSGFSSESEPEEDDTRMDESVRLAEVIGVTGKAVATKATLTQLVTERQRERERERERERNDFENHSQKVSAARKRSSRASKASLRLPRRAGSDTPVDRGSIVSRRSRSRSKSLRRGSTAAAVEAGPSSFKPPVPTLQVDTVSLKKSPKDDSFLEIETRPVSPATPLASEVPPPLPTNMNAVIAAQSGAQPAEDFQDKRATFDFEIPPITISSPGDESDTLGRGSSRRVYSMLPTIRSRSQEPDDGQRRSASDFRKFDVWPWQATSTKKTRRRSMPLTGFVGPSNVENIVPPPRVFSPPPSYTTGPPHP